MMSLYIKNYKLAREYNTNMKNCIQIISMPLYEHKTFYTSNLIQVSEYNKFVQTYK